MTPQVYLRKGKEESLMRRHPWIFSGAIDHIKAEDESEITEGALVEIYTRTGDFIALGHYQIGSIAVRVLTFDKEPIDQAWWNRRIAVAYDVRRTLGLTDNPDTDCYRLVHGEGDGLPGLVVDIYGTVAVVQCHSVGMYLARQDIARAILAAYGDRITAIYDKSSQTVPFNARLGAVDGYLWGSSDHSAHVVTENGEKFLVNWEQGQKTGFFLDQRENRELVKRYSKGRTVLNTFCYTGGFSVYAMAGGAEKVCSVDSSERAVVLATENMKLNFGPQANFTETAADAVEYLKNIEDKYDLIILDPPAFAKHHKVLGNAMQGYKRLNARAISQIRPGGILFTFSCSQAVSKELFRTMIFSAAAIAGRNVRILHQLTQPADHPVSIYHPEGEYLKGLVLYVEEGKKARPERKWKKPHARPTPTARSAISSTASGTSGRCWYSTTSIRAGACVFRKSTAGRPTSRRRCSHRHSASWNRTGCCRARSTPRCRPAWNMRSRPAASRSCPTSQRLSGGQRKISTPSSKTGSGKRYSDGQSLPGKSSGYLRTAPCRQPSAKRCQPTAK